jgi:hypothetical protein
LCGQHSASDTQDMNVTEQLNSGIRFLDIRLKKVNNYGSHV